MSTTSSLPTNREWLHRLLSGRPHQVIGGPEDPYMLRWYVIPRNPVLNVYLHKFMRSDDDRALHDHPWWFISLMLRGAYTEVTEQGGKRRRSSVRFTWGLACALAGALLMRRTPRAGVLLTTGGLLDIGEATQRDGAIAFRSAEWRHRVELDWADGRTRRGIPAWTLIVTGRRVRTWGFWCKGYTDYLDRVEVPDRFIKWDEFGDAGCGEPQ